MQIKLSVIAGAHQGQEFVFDGHENFIMGRGIQAHLRLPKLDPYFSRLHFMVEINPPQCRLLDLGSHNGTWVNRRKVKLVDLRSGDEIRAGRTVLRVEFIEGPTPADGPKRTEEASPLGDFPQTQSLVLPEVRTPSDFAAARALARDAVEELIPLKDDGPSTFAPMDLHRYLPRDFEERIRSRPQPLNGYELVAEIGRGGMGAVYLAICQRDSGVCAVKTMLPAVRDARATEFFLREAQTLKQLSHPHIVPFREMGECGGLLFFAMEFVPGDDAATLLKKMKGPLPGGRAVRLVCQAMEALDFAHLQGFVHRDVKPANLLVAQTSEGEVAKLADFGLARVWQNSSLSGLTMTGQVGGTTPYMAPEQITDYRNAKPAVDQYAAAAMLYRMLTENYIYDFPSKVDQQLTMILQEKPVPIQQRKADIPDRLAFIIHRALAKNPADRFENMATFRQALRPFEQD